MNVSRSERAPTVDELFSRGNRAGTQAFELGNPDFGTERGWGVEALLHGRGRDYHISISAFYNRFSSFIYDHVLPDAACLAANGGQPLDFPCFQFSQAPARYYGAEIEGEVTFGRIGKTEIKADALADYTNTTITGGVGGPVPRIPPQRILGGLSADAGRLNGLEVEHDFAQDRISVLETPTAAFTLVNASIGWQPLPDNKKVRLLVSANNRRDRPAPCQHSQGLRATRRTRCQGNAKPGNLVGQPLDPKKSAPRLQGWGRFVFKKQNAEAIC